MGRYDRTRRLEAANVVIEPRISLKETLDRLRDSYANMASRLVVFVRGLVLSGGRERCVRG